MSKIIINGGNKLKGDIAVEGSKNAVLPILAATVLNGGINVIKNCPRINDVIIMIKILQTIGCKVSFEGNCCVVDSSTITSTEIPDDLAAEMRSSIIFMGPILARGGNVTISYPGGCDILLALKKSFKTWNISNFLCIYYLSFVERGLNSENQVCMHI